MTQAGRRSGLSGNALKVIAIIAMTIDHVAWIGIYNYAQAETLPQILVHCIGQRGKARWLGRFFYWYYPAHMALIGLIVRLFPLGQ